MRDSSADKKVLMRQALRSQIPAMQRRVANAPGSTPAIVYSTKLTSIRFLCRRRRLSITLLRVARLHYIAP